MTEPVIFDCQQGTPEWFACRIGIPTASRFSDVLAKGEGKLRSKYLRQLAGEIITGEPMETYSNKAMERGNAMEPRARQLYSDLLMLEGESGMEIRQVGFIRRGDAGGSPDSFVGDHGLLEIKTMQPDLLIELLERPDNWFHSGHEAQCQGNLWVSGREWCDLIIYWPGMPVLRRRTLRSAPYIQILQEEIDLFNLDLRRMVAKLRARLS